MNWLSDHWVQVKDSDEISYWSQQPTAMPRKYGFFLIFFSFNSAIMPHAISYETNLHQASAYQHRRHPRDANICNPAENDRQHGQIMLIRDPQSQVFRRRSFGISDSEGPPVLLSGLSSFKLSNILPRRGWSWRSFRLCCAASPLQYLSSDMDLILDLEVIEIVYKVLMSVEELKLSS